MNKIVAAQSRRNSTQRGRKVAARHAQAGHWSAQSKPMLTSGKIDYEIGANIDATSFGGIAAVHRLAVRLGLVDAINDRLELLKVHLPYHESDHVLNLAYNVLCGGRRLAGHRAAAPRHRVHERAGRGPDPRPDHRRGLLPPLR